MQEIAESTQFINVRRIRIYERKTFEIAGTLKQTQAFGECLCYLNVEKRVKNQTKTWKVREKQELIFGKDSKTLSGQIKVSWR